MTLCSKLQFEVLDLRSQIFGVVYYQMPPIGPKVNSIPILSTMGPIFTTPLGNSNLKNLKMAKFRGGVAYARKAH